MYFLIYVYLFKLQGYKNEEIIHNKDNIEFALKYSKILHHLRGFNSEIKINKPEDLLYSIEENLSNRDIFLFLGDSWIEQLIFYKESRKLINNFFKNKRFTYINGGITSYSPTLITLQYKIIKKDFNINPNYLVVYVDQTDFGDEICRYKDNKHFDSKYNLIGVKDFFYAPRISTFNKINNSNSSILIKNIRLLNFLISERANLAVNKIKRYFNKGHNPYGCHISEILEKLIDPTEKDEKYFQETINFMLDTFNNDKNLKKVIVVTFPHRNNIKQIKNFKITKEAFNKMKLSDELFFERQDSKDKVYRDYKVNISDYVNNYLNEENKNKIIHIDFTKKLFSKEIDIILSDFVTNDPASHLNEASHSEIFVKNIINDINKSLNNNTN